MAIARSRMDPKLTRWLRARLYMYLHMRFMMACFRLGFVVVCEGGGVGGVWIDWYMHTYIIIHVPDGRTMETMMEMKSMPKPRAREVEYRMT